MHRRLVLRAQVRRRRWRRRARSGSEMQRGSYLWIANTTRRHSYPGGASLQRLPLAEFPLRRAFKGGIVDAPFCALEDRDVLLLRQLRPRESDRDFDLFAGFLG